MHWKKTSNITYGISRDLTNKNKDSAIKIGDVTNKYEIQWIDVRQILQESRVSEPKMCSFHPFLGNIVTVCHCSELGQTCQTF